MKQNPISVNISGREISYVELLEKELERSRANLKLLRRKLGMDGMKRLFSEELEQSHRLYCDYADRFDGTYKAANVDMEVEGVTGEEFLEWLMKKSAVNGGEELLHNHPDHWATYCSPDGTSQTAIETMACGAEDGVPFAASLTLPDPDGFAEPPIYDIPSYGALTAPDGTPLHIRSLHQFRNTETGCKVRLGLYFPSCVSDEYIEGCKWHLAVEWKNWFDMLFADREA